MALIPGLLRRSGALEFAAVALPGASLLAATCIGLFELGLKSEVTNALPLMPLLAVLFMGARGAIVFGVGATLGAVLLAYCAFAAARPQAHLPAKAAATLRAHSRSPQSPFSPAKKTPNARLSIKIPPSHPSI